MLACTPLTDRMGDCTDGISAAKKPWYYHNNRALEVKTALPYFAKRGDNVLE